MTQDTPKKLEAPHRRLESTPPRFVEKAAVIGYKSMAAALVHLPPKLTVPVIGAFNQLSYLAWPKKRRFVNANFGKVMGLPPEHVRVRRMALRAYREYAHYMVEIMRLPAQPVEAVSNLTTGTGVDKIVDAWKAHGKSMIVCAGHVGNNEAVAAGVAHRGLPANVVADDSTFPEIFEILRKNREDWGVHVIPWRNLRELFSVLRKNQLLALLVDWGYRPDGIPVKLFGSWTALPAGPAVLGAKTGAAIVFMEVRRTRDGLFEVSAEDVFTVPSSDPADLQRATQKIADALERTLAKAPAQWYSFKPIWPETEEEAAELERRAGEMLAGRPGAPKSADGAGDASA
ncbi:MAG: lysophospholipid acyltransferase family protein [Chloroflexota bacterium]